MSYIAMYEKKVVMNTLHPTIWRTCRVLSNESRLKLLWQLFHLGKASVSELGNLVGLSEPVASSYLRALNARGLISPERQRTFVFYRLKANPEVAHAERMLLAMKTCWEGRVSFSDVTHQMTAFTHSRRIDIVRALSGGALEEAQLSVKTSISPQALYRHVEKLVSRGFVKKRGHVVQLLEPDAALSRALLEMVLD